MSEKVRKIYQKLNTWYELFKDVETLERHILDNHPYLTSIPELTIGDYEKIKRFLKKRNVPTKEIENLIIHYETQRREFKKDVTKYQNSQEEANKTCYRSSAIKRFQRLKSFIKKILETIDANWR